MSVKYASACSGFHSSREDLFQFTAEVSIFHEREVFPGDNQDILRGRKPVLVQAEELSQEPLHPVAPYGCFPHLFADDEPEAPHVRGVRAENDCQVLRVNPLARLEKGRKLAASAEPLVFLKRVPAFGGWGFSCGWAHPSTLPLPGSDGQSLSPLCTPSAQDQPPTLGGHPGAKSVAPLALEIRNGLECLFHKLMILLS